MSEFKCAWSIDDFTATAVYTGENRLVRVQGTGSCPSTGFSVGLEMTNPGINPARQRIDLALVESEPGIGEDTLTPVTIDEIFDASEEKTEVGIRYVGVLTIQEPS